MEESVNFSAGTSPECEDKKPLRLCDFSPLALAYMGDAVYELLTREKLVMYKNQKAAQLNKAARGYVTAIAQSEAVNRLLPLLSEDEEAVYKLGRNAKSAHSPKSAGTVDYRRATGSECLFGWLWISGKQERAKELFDLIYPDDEFLKTE